MSKVRRFESVKGEHKKHSGVYLPIRADKGSVGYDFYSLEDVTIPANRIEDINGLKVVFSEHTFWTDVKVEMPEEECLLIEVRSSIGIKKHLKLKNGTGVIDSSYYGNASNDGNIGINLVNYSHEDVVIKKGERIAQGIFVPVNFVNEEEFIHESRKGGSGSSGQ